MIHHRNAKIVQEKERRISRRGERGGGRDTHLEGP
jgi:hypothetical protein